jgi:hypothetical protein
MQKIQAYSHNSTFLPTPRLFPAALIAGSFLQAYFAFPCIFNYTQRFLLWTALPTLPAVMREQERYMSKIHTFIGFRRDCHLNDKLTGYCKMWDRKPVPTLWRIMMSPSAQWLKSVHVEVSKPECPHYSETDDSNGEFLRNVRSYLLSYTASVAHLVLSTPGTINHNDNYELKNITTLYGIFCHSTPRLKICSESKIKIFHLTHLFCHPNWRPLDHADREDCTTRPFPSPQLRLCRA